VLQKSLDTYLSEIQNTKAESHQTLKVRKVIEDSRIAYNHLVILSSLALPRSSSTCCFNENNSHKINKLFDRNVLSCSYLNNDINIVFNFHLENLLEILTNMKELY